MEVSWSAAWVEWTLTRHRNFVSHDRSYVDSLASFPDHQWLKFTINLISTFHTRPSLVEEEAYYLGLDLTSLHPRTPILLAMGMFLASQRLTDSKPPKEGGVYDKDCETIVVFFYRWLDSIRQEHIIAEGSRWPSITMTFVILVSEVSLTLQFAYWYVLPGGTWGS